MSPQSPGSRRAARGNSRDARTCLLLHCGEVFGCQRSGLTKLDLLARPSGKHPVDHAAVELDTQHMNPREQFGATLSTFQALRHRAADVKMLLELGRSMSDYASLKLGEPVAARRRPISQAKAQLGQSMRFVGQQCIQTHGGIGVTDECAGAHYFKRLTMLETAFGDTMHHLGEVSMRMQPTAGVFA